MTTRMLIDARHPEETRVAVLTGNRIEEFDFDSADHKQIKGNIYLAKVTRVEPSLQAAFVDFGGNRHGFLAFSEIHPDYYQIPKEDREALLAEEAAHAVEEAALRAAEDAEDDAFAASGGRFDDDDSGSDGDGDHRDGNGGGSVTEIDTSEKDHVATIEDGHVDNGFDAEDHFDGEFEDGASASGDDDDDHPAARHEHNGDDDGNPGARRRGRRQGRGPGGDSHGQAKDSRGQADDLRARRMALRRRYKIQDVIQRRQVLLVQVVKEERGNKGAALTSYLSLAGRYCVLMPNSSTGGGISRKISSVSDRKRLKSIIAEMALPKSMGCIVRTAGLQRTKTEIKRDFDYLARLWDDIRETTLHSSAPALIHSDSDLIKRAIRDIYNRDYRGSDRRRRRRLSACPRFHEAADAQPCAPGEGLYRSGAAVPALRSRGPAYRDVRSRRAAQIRRLHRHQPDRGAGLDRHQFGPLHQGSTASRRPPSTPIWKPRARSRDSCACATWPGWW